MNAVIVNNRDLCELITKLAKIFKDIDSRLELLCVNIKFKNNPSQYMPGLSNIIRKMTDSVIHYQVLVSGHNKRNRNFFNTNKYEKMIDYKQYVYSNINIIDINSISEYVIGWRRLCESLFTVINCVHSNLKFNADKYLTNPIVENIYRMIKNEYDNLLNFFIDNFSDFLSWTNTEIDIVLKKTDDIKLTVSSDNVTPPIKKTNPPIIIKSTPPTTTATPLQRLQRLKQDLFSTKNLFPVRHTHVHTTQNKSVNVVPNSRPNAVPNVRPNTRTNLLAVIKPINNQSTNANRSNLFISYRTPIENRNSLVIPPNLNQINNSIGVTGASGLDILSDAAISNSCAPNLIVSKEIDKLLNSTDAANNLVDFSKSKESNSTSDNEISIIDADIVTEGEIDVMDGKSDFKNVNNKRKRDIIDYEETILLKDTPYDYLTPGMYIIKTNDSIKTNDRIKTNDSINKGIIFRKNKDCITIKDDNNFSHSIANNPNNKFTIVLTLENKKIKF